ncbi:MAG: fasciclin domain-containing protein [Planctomycetota bacterium]
MIHANILTGGLLLVGLLPQAPTSGADASERTTAAQNASPEHSVDTDSQRVVAHTEETIAVAFAREVELNPMLVGFIKVDNFRVFNTGMHRTIFVPSPEHLEADAFASLVDDPDSQPLQDMLNSHVAFGKVLDEHFDRGMGVLVVMMDGDKHRSVKLNRDDVGRPTVNGMRVLRTIDAPNGIIHVIDGMIEQPEL